MTNPKISILLIGGEIPGGAERRIASYTRHAAVVSDMNLTLIINSELLTQLSNANLMPGCRVVVLRSWYMEKEFEKLIFHSPNNFFYILMRRLFKFTCNISLCAQFGLYFIFNPIDVFQVVLGGSRLIAFPFLMLKKFALICSVVGTEIRDYSGYSYLDRYILRVYLRKSDVIDALSVELQDILIKLGFIDESKIFVSDSFVEATPMPISDEKQDWVVFAGRLIHKKGPLLFLDAIPKILSVINGKVHFFILGFGDLTDLIQDRIRAYGIEQVVTVEFNNHIVDVLTKSRIFCSLQDKENYPSRSLLEAMACGNAIVATDVGYTHLLVNEETGIRVEPTSPAIADAIIQLLSEPEKTAKMGENASSLVSDKYSPKSYCNRMKTMYEKALFNCTV